MLRTAFLILSGNAAASALLLARNLLIARLIPVEDYGIAATFGIIMALIEMASYLGLQQQIIQSADGEDPRFQAALQGFQVLRGAIAAVVLFISADLIARFLGIPEVAWAYQVIALVPLLNGFQHFDIHRLNRAMRFAPLILTGTVPALIALLSVWPLYLWLGDYRVMLYSMMLQLGLGLAVSHLVADRPYRLVFDPGIMARSLKFGWPLLVNSILMFAVFQGDKLIVGRATGMETLAIFAMGMTLTLTPALVMTKSLQNFFLPQLKPGTTEFDRTAGVTVEAALLAGLLLILATLLVGQPVVSALLGDKYADLLPLITWSAILHATRLFKAGPSIIALASGHTANAMQANIPRVLALPAAWVVATETGSLEGVILVGLAGELVGHGVAMARLHYRTGVAFRSVAKAHAGAGLLVGLATLQAATPALHPATSPQGFAIMGMGTILCFGLGYRAFPHIRAYIDLRK